MVRYKILPTFRVLWQHIGYVRNTPTKGNMMDEYKRFNKLEEERLPNSLARRAEHVRTMKTLKDQEASVLQKLEPLQKELKEIQDQIRAHQDHAKEERRRLRGALRVRKDGRLLIHDIQMGVL